MADLPLAHRLTRAWLSLRPVPPSQLVRRLVLRGRQKLHGFAPEAGLSGLTPALAASLPLAALPPRTGQLERTPDGYRLTFPWGSREFGTGLPWDLKVDGWEAGSWRSRLHYMEYLEEADDAGFVQLVEDWIARNPPGGPAALRYSWRAFNLSIRAVVWMQEIARRRDRLPGPFLALAAGSLARQLRFLETHLETDLRGNHLVKNLKALLWAGAFFEGDEARRWGAKGRALLVSELDEQVLADGCHYERSPPYHAQVLADFLDCHAALPAGDPLRAVLEERLAGMAAALLRLTHPDGQVALYNDGGLSMAPPPAAVLGAYAARTGREASVPNGGFALPAAGFYGFMAPGEYCLADCGELAPGYLIGHGHGDILAFEWSTAGWRILVDQGTFQNLAGPRRRLSRSTLSHNTIVIDGAEMADFYGAHRCGRRPRPELRGSEATPDRLSLTGSHDGYRHLAGAPAPVRTIVAEPGLIRLHDRVEGGAGQPAESRFLLHPACSVELLGSAAVIRREGVEVRLEASVAVRSEPAEWYPDLYRAEPTTRLVLAVPAGEEGLRLSFRRVAAA